MILSKQWYKLGDISFAGFLRLFGTNNFSGIVHFDEFLEKEVIFVKVNIFWDTPLYDLPRLKFVFLSVFPTDTCEMLSITSKRINLSCINLKVHRL